MLSKADSEKVKLIHSEIRQETLSQLTTMKKDLLTKLSRKDEDITNIKVEAQSQKQKHE
jgi:flagellar biosynthesis/type III secretory pathway chaperone